MKNLFHVLFAFMLVLSLGGMICDDDDDDAPHAYGRVDNQTSYYINNATFATKNFGTVNPNTNSGYQEIPLAGGKFTFTIPTYTGTCETTYLEPPDENKYYTIVITGGGLNCGNFNYAVTEP